MANNLLVSTAARNAAMDAVTLLINSGGAGSIEVYTGSQPAGPNTAVSSQTLLVTLTFLSDAFGDANSGASVANAITSGTAVAAGTAAWFRIKNGAGTAVIDGTVGTSSADLILGTTTISVGNVVSCSSFTLTHPA